MIKRRLGVRGLAVAVGSAALVVIASTSAISAPDPNAAAEKDKAAGQQARAAAPLGPPAGRASSLAEEDAARATAAQSRVAALDSDEQKPGAGAERAAASAAPVAGSRFTGQSLQQVKDELIAKAGKPGVAYGFYYDARTDSVVVEGNLPEAQLPQTARAKGLITYKHSADAGRVSRYNDSLPHWGGSAIFNGGVRCSSAFNVRNSAGTRLAVTAGHCGNLWSSWTSGSYFFGTMTSRAPFPTWDLALLSGSSYGSYIYMGNSTGVGTPTGAFSNPVVGSFYCTSGTTTFENCGKQVTSLSGTFCDAAGCTPALATFQGGTMIAGGDSGGPLVLRGSTTVYPRGVVIARAGSTMFAEKWSTVASFWGVSGVTSG